MRVTSSVRRAYAQTEEWVGVLVKADLDRGVLTGVVEQVVEAMLVSTEAVDGLTPVEFLSTMSGPAVLLGDVDPEDLGPVLDRVGQLLVEGLAVHGVGEVTLTAMPTVNPFGRGEGPMSLVQVWLGLRGRRPVGWKPVGWKPVGWDPQVEPHGRPHWEVDPADLDAAIGQLVAWVLDLGGDGVKIAVASEEPYVPVPAEAVLPMVRRVAEQRRMPLTNSVVVTNASGRVRWVDLHRWWGSMVAAEGTLPGVAPDWEAALSQTRRLLTLAGPWCAYGHLTATSRVSMDADNGLRIVRPHLSDNDQRTLIESGTLVDAYGVMRLPRSWAERLPLAPLWTSTVLPGGDVLAEHVDPGAWYAGHRIDPATLSAARDHLGGAVIDRTDEILAPII